MNWLVIASGSDNDKLNKAKDFLLSKTGEDPNVILISENQDLEELQKNFRITAREAQILKLITQGYSNNEIAKELFVSINTTKAHVANILQKLEVEDRLQAALKALKHKIV